MKLNPKKCVFEVEYPASSLASSSITEGIEANPAKIQALINMRSPRNVKEVKSLTGRVAALNRFVFEVLRQVPSVLQGHKEGGEAL